MDQSEMFPDGEDLPLFSGIPQTVTIQTNDRPEHWTRQLSYASCRVCRDTGVVDDKFCWCDAGRRAKVAYARRQERTSK